MEGVQEKETIESNPQCITRSKKREESDGNDLLSLLQLDLKNEILWKVPPKSLVNLFFVSKLWSSIIRSKGFTKLYLTRSSFRQRFLLCFTTGGMHLFQSCSQEDRSCSDNHRVSFTQDPVSRYRICKPVHGLICCYDNNDTKVVIGNPSTGQFVALPEVQTTSQSLPETRRRISTFFGYDPVDEVYKVLCMSVKKVRSYQSNKPMSEEHQVFTIGAKQKWRMIKCKHPHHPCLGSEGICKNGFVYYSALSNNERFLISFDLSAEDFDVIKLPEAARGGEFCNLLNYNGKIALTTQTMHGTLDLWVLEDVSKKEWSKVSILVPSWRDLVGCDLFLFRGVISTGELIFTPYYPPNQLYILCYDLKENSSRKVLIEGTIDDDDSAIIVFVDHEESPMILPKVS